MRTEKMVRAAATALAATILALAATQGAAIADATPPPAVPPPAVPPRTLDSCIATYQQSRAAALFQFRTALGIAIAEDKTEAELAADVILVLGILGTQLVQAQQDLISCAGTATGGPAVYHAANLQARRAQTGGGGTAGCQNSFDKAVKKATRAEDRSFRKKRHAPTTQQATDTFDAAVQAAGQKLATCLQNATR